MSNIFISTQATLTETEQLANKFHRVKKLQKKQITVRCYNIRIYT